MIKELKYFEDIGPVQPKTGTNNIQVNKVIQVRTKTILMQWIKQKAILTT